MSRDTIHIIPAAPGYLKLLVVARVRTACWSMEDTWRALRTSPVVAWRITRVDEDPPNGDKLEECGSVWPVLANPIEYRGVSDSDEPDVDEYFEHVAGLERPDGTVFHLDDCEVVELKDRDAFIRAATSYINWEFERRLKEEAKQRETAKAARTTRSQKSQKQPS